MPTGSEFEDGENAFCDRRRPSHEWEDPTGDVVALVVDFGLTDFELTGAAL